MNGHRRRSSALVIVIMAALAPGGVARGQEDARKMYEDALVQLKAAQDRKAELAAENEKLAARVADLERRLSEARADVAKLAAESFSARARASAWERFLAGSPELAERWRAYLGASLSLDRLNGPADLLDLVWPLTPDEADAAQPDAPSHPAPATQPETLPSTTQP